MVMVWGVSILSLSISILKVMVMVILIPSVVMMRGKGQKKYVGNIASFEDKLHCITISCNAEYSLVLLQSYSLGIVGLLSLLWSRRPLEGLSGSFNIRHALCPFPSFHQGGGFMFLDVYMCINSS